MKILHVPFGYFPDVRAGTEVYVASLCQSLRPHGVESAVAAPGTWQGSYQHEGVQVHRFAVHAALTQDMMFGAGDPIAAQGFAQVLDETKPDVVHFHAFSPAIGRLAMHEVKQRSLPCVTTYHTPTTSCARGTLMRWGDEVCDGDMRTNRCGACFLHSHGMPRLLADAVATMSWLSSPLSRLPGLSNAQRAVLGTARLMQLRQGATREWWAAADRIIALCEWTRRLLLLNGVPETRIRKVRHGLAVEARTAAQPNLSLTPLRFAFLGRLDATKGIDLVVDALRMMPSLSVQVDLFTISPPEADPKMKRLFDDVKKDPRLRLREPVSSSEVIDTLTNYHALLVPSRWLETGPLVVLEAFAAGVPVIGSRLGGIAEWVTHEQDGLLVEEPSVEAWLATLTRAVEETDLLPRLRKGVCPPRSMREVAKEMMDIYSEVLIA